MVTQPPRSNGNRSTPPPNGTSGQSPSARQHPGRQPKATPPPPPGQAQGSGQGGAPEAKLPKATPTARRARTTRPANAPVPPQEQAKQSARGSAASVLNKVKAMRPSGFLAWVNGMVGTVRKPNTTGIAALVLGVLAIVGLGYGLIVQSQAVNHASQLEGFRARVVTAVVVSHQFGSMNVDVNGNDVRVAQAKEVVPVGQPLRVRINPVNPNYLVDARIQPEEAVGTAKRNRLFTLLIALVFGAAAAYLVLSGKAKP